MNVFAISEWVSEWSVLNVFAISDWVSKWSVLNVFATISEWVSEWSVECECVRNQQLGELMVS